jgi:hypothetical protein
MLKYARFPPVLVFSVPWGVRETVKMRQKVYVQDIGGMEDMAALELAIGGLLGGEHNKCSLVRSNEFVQLRLCALYGKGEKPMHVYGEGLQISLDDANVASVYLLCSSVDADEVLLGKRPEREHGQAEQELADTDDP